MQIERIVYTGANLGDLIALGKLKIDGEWKEALFRVLINLFRMDQTFEVRGAWGTYLLLEEIGITLSEVDFMQGFTARSSYVLEPSIQLRANGIYYWIDPVAFVFWGTSTGGYYGEKDYYGAEDANYGDGNQGYDDSDAPYQMIQSETFNNALCNISKLHDRITPDHEYMLPWDVGQGVPDRVEHIPYLDNDQVKLIKQVVYNDKRWVTTRGWTIPDHPLNDVLNTRAYCDSDSRMLSHYSSISSKTYAAQTSMIENYYPRDTLTLYKHYSGSDTYAGKIKERRRNWIQARAIKTFRNHSGCKIDYAMDTSFYTLVVKLSTHHDIAAITDLETVITYDNYFTYCHGSQLHIVDMINWREYYSYSTQGDAFNRAIFNDNEKAIIYLNANNELLVEWV